MRLLFSISILIVFASCKKKENQINSNGVPYVKVDQTIYNSDPIFSNVYAVGGWVYLAGGSKGIILYHKSTDEFTALDRHSTYNVQNGCQLFVDKSGVVVVDTCSGSEFLISDGYVLKGPATLPLTQYQTKYDGSALRIYN
jgi:hypothetical protein